MDLLKESESRSRPPLLDGTNYRYWKVHIHVFIKSPDMKAWILV